MGLESGRHPVKLRREGKVLNTAVYVVLGVSLDGQRDTLGIGLVMAAKAPTSG